MSAGQPWCVGRDLLERYKSRSPIEIKCSASGSDALSVGHPSGCWWLMKYAKKDLQRWPGRIVVPDLPPKGGTVRDGPGMSLQDAEIWMREGRLPASFRRRAAGRDFLSGQAASAVQHKHESL